MKVLNFGSCNIDYVYELDRIVQPGETISAAALSTHAGGKGLNQSIATARAGGEIYHAGNIGEDGEWLRELLAQSGANTEYLRQCDARTGHAMIQVDSSGENCIIVYAGANALLDDAQIDDVLGHFSAGDLCILQNETPCTAYIIKAASARGLRVLWNPSPMNGAVDRENVGLCSYVIVNRSEGQALTDEQQPEKIAQAFAARYPNTALVLTLGSHGSIYRDGTVSVDQAPYEARPVDTTGAGDTFTGYFAAAISRGKTPIEAMRCASAASAMATETMGAANSIPTLAEVEARIAAEG